MSFHDKAEVLEKILKEHPEIEDKNLSDISLPDSHGLPFRFSPLDSHGLYLAKNAG